MADGSTSWPASHQNRRPSDYESDAPRRPGRLQADLACSRWVPRRSRWLQTDPEGSSGDQMDDQGASDRQSDAKAHGLALITAHSPWTTPLVWPIWSSRYSSPPVGVSWSRSLSAGPG